ncbi:MAG: hypothetical protein H6529_18620 [Nocardioides sp.]|nr:hypothetical protein [Nocardioidaceae bacterium]MCB8958476.1 hypothetical protein [Nocardioides sp.]
MRDDRPGTDAAVERSFLVVRVVRGSLLVAFLALAAIGVEARGWPHGVTLAVGAAALLLLARLAHDVRRLRATRRQRTG